MNLTHYFSEPKVDDIIIVYSGTSSGINTLLWAINFSLPTVWSTIRAVEMGAHIVYQETGEMLLNSTLSEEVIPFSGVDAMNSRTEEYWEKDRPGGWEIWEGKMMSLTGSP